MGVIKDPNDLFFTGYIEDDLGLQEVDQEDDNVTVGAINEVLQRHKSKIGRNKSKKFDELNLLSKSHIGVRKARRTANLQFILNMVDKEEVDTDFPIFRNPPYVSAFAQLFMDEQKMKIWNDFVDGKLNRKKKERNESENDEDEEDWEEIPDKRVEHPAYTAEKSFQRLNGSIRKLLKRRRPLGLLEKLEDEIVTFFRDWPNSVFISEIACNYERLLLHTLCDFLCLQSKSFDREGVRRTHIENLYDDFLPPKTLLSEYLEKNYCKSQL